MSTCEYYVSLISAALDCELSEEESRTLAEHLEVCEECRAVKAAFEAVSGALGEYMEEAPESLHENVMAEVRRIEIKKKNSRWRMRKLAACAAVVILGGIGIGVLGFGSSAKSAQTVEFAAAEAPAAAPAANVPSIAAYSAGMPEAAMAAEAYAEEDALGSMYFELYGMGLAELEEYLELSDTAEESLDFDTTAIVSLPDDEEGNALVLYICGEDMYIMDADGVFVKSAKNVTDFTQFVYSDK